MSKPKCSPPARPIRKAAAVLGALLAVTALWSAAPHPASAAAAKSGGTCPSRSVGAVTSDAKGQPLVCTKITRTKFQWKVPPLGSYIRPVPLGQVAVGGPAENRFRVRVTRVNLDGTAEVLASSTYAVAPAPDVRFVLVDVEAAFAGPAAEGTTGHYWYARSADGTAYSASQGCGGYGTTFDVATVVPIGGIVAGTHCFEVPASAVDSLRMRLDGAGAGDTHFALR